MPPVSRARVTQALSTSISSLLLPSFSEPISQRTPSGPRKGEKGEEAPFWGNAQRVQATQSHTRVRGDTHLTRLLLGCPEALPPPTGPGHLEAGVASALCSPDLAEPPPSEAANTPPPPVRGQGVWQGLTLPPVKVSGAQERPPRPRPGPGLEC